MHFIYLWAFCSLTFEKCVTVLLISHVEMLKYCIIFLFAKLRKATISSSCLSVRPYVRMQQLGSRCANIHEICHVSIFRKSVRKIQVLLQSEKSNGYFIRKRTYIYYNISLIYSQNGYVLEKICV